LGLTQGVRDAESSAAMNAQKIIFVTGTDTGVGKTLLAAFLLHHLRQSPGRTLAMKPFCSGGMGDVRLLQSLQPGELSDAEMNPFYFAQPIAPAIAANKRKITLSQVLNRISEVEAKCDRLIIEGSGGLLVPLGQGYTVADLMAALDCEVVVAARNQLGTINHTLLTVKALQSLGIESERIKVVLMNGGSPDLSSETNKKVIATWLKPIPVSEFPFLGSLNFTAKSVKRIYPKVTKTVSKITGLAK
jgi:dethiobiotin synthetase